ncbi:ABC transporter substrate-binding protein [Halococcus agarilyticus]|uniref:ABC transporter substrate-binding protein n=1 Tax=Halococcus agarilyticus TaxID=1232219 RepID=UPI0009ACBB38|nr:ABC transporter substrate-binding protein [Halococcus agarilyticus]
MPALRFPNRRRFLQTLGVSGAAAALAGCSGGGGSGDSTSTAGGGGGGTEASGGGTTEATATSGGGNASTEGGNASEETQQSGGQRTVGGNYIAGSSTDAQTLNFIQVSDVPSSNRIGLALDSAYAITTENEVFPLWLDLESGPDNRVYTANLRDNLQWGGDYGQMTAEDWVYMIKNVYQTEDNWAAYSNRGDWQREGEFIPVEKTGKLSFEIRLPNPDPAFPLKPILWGAFCMPKGLLEQYVPDKDLEGLQQDEEISTLAYSGNLGPYSFERWDREAAFVATRNDDYYMRDASDVPAAWQGAPYFDQYTYRVIGEQSTRLSALQANEITTTAIPSTQVSQFEGSDDTSVVVAPQPFCSQLIYNRRANSVFAEGFRSTAVRRALAYAVDKQLILENILNGYGNVAHTFQPQFSDFYDDSQVEQFGVGDTFSMEQARSELQSALGDTPYAYEGGQVVNENGNQVTLTLVYTTGSQTTETTCKYFKQQFEKLGFAVSLTAVRFNTLLDKYVTNSPTNGNFGDEEGDWSAGPFNAGERTDSVSPEQWDMMYGIVFNTYPRTPTSTDVFWQRETSTNFFGYYPEANLNELYSRASTATDQQTRQQALASIFGALSKEQANLFTNMGVDIIGYQPNVVGPDETFGFGWDDNIWYFDEA